MISYPVPRQLHYLLSQDVSMCSEIINLVMRNLVPSQLPYLGSRFLTNPDSRALLVSVSTTSLVTIFPSRSYNAFVILCATLAPAEPILFIQIVINSQITLSSSHNAPVCPSDYLVYKSCVRI